jgi:hypothetical protein
MKSRRRIVVAFEGQNNSPGTLSLTRHPQRPEDDCVIIRCDVKRGLQRYGGLLVLDKRDYPDSRWEKFCETLVKVVNGKRRRALSRADESNTIEALFTSECHWIAVNAWSRWLSNAVFPPHLVATPQKHRFSPGRPSGWALEAVLVKKEDMIRLSDYCSGVLRYFNDLAGKFATVRK